MYTKNSYHLYANDVSLFGTIIGNNLVENPRIYAYKSGSKSLCTCNKKNTIENIFKSPFECNDVELAISSNTGEITFPFVSCFVNIFIKFGKSIVFTINSVSSLKSETKSITVNVFCIFTEKKEILA